MRYTHFFMVPEIGASRLNQTLKKDAEKRRTDHAFLCRFR